MFSGFPQGDLQGSPHTHSVPKVLYSDIGGKENDKYVPYIYYFM